MDCQEGKICVKQPGDSTLCVENVKDEEWCTGCNENNWNKEKQEKKMKIKDISENWERKQVDREDGLEAKLWVRKHWSERRAKVDQRFELKWYIKSLSPIKRYIAKKILSPWFEKKNRENSCYHSADGVFAYPDVSLDD